MLYIYNLFNFQNNFSQYLQKHDEHDLIFFISGSTYSKFRIRCDCQQKHGNFFSVQFEIL